MTLLQDAKAIAFPETSSPGFLPALVELFGDLNAQGIRYCHWKSNVRLEQSLMGKTDLDLLIDPADAKRFEGLLAARHVKHILAPAGKQYPGLEHYLGFDAQTGRLFHLHVHYQLVLGEQFVKNYRLPLEDVFLNSTYLRHGVKIPLPELELIVLSLRTLLKYRDRDVVKDILKIRSPGLPSHVVDEFRWLLEQTSISSVADVLAQLPVQMPSGAIFEILETVISDQRDGLKLLQLRGQVRRALRPYQRQERLQASAKYFQESWRRRLAWRFAPEQKMTLPQKGLTIALVGVDGAGKSTLCAGLSNWLGWKLESPLYYLGSKQPSRRSQWLYTFFRMARRSQREMSTRFGENGPVVRLLANIRQTLLYSHQLSIGYDRYRRYQFAQKKAEGGAVVIFDRYPFEAPLDGPEIHIMSRGQAGLLSVYFSRLEQELYRRFGFPDFLVLLRVSPQLSMQRKPDHLPETIAAKHRALDALQDTLMNHPRKNWALVDANAAYEDVLLQVKQQIWAIL